MKILDTIFLVVCFCGIFYCIGKIQADVEWRTEALKHHVAFSNALNGNLIWRELSPTFTEPQP